METRLTHEAVMETVAAMRMPDGDKEILLRRALAGEPEAGLAVFWAALTGGRAMSAARIAHYAFARRPDGKIGPMLVTRENGRQVSEEWTGRKLMPTWSA